MKLLKISLLSLAIFLPLLPQYLKNSPPPPPAVKSVSVHQLDLPKARGKIEVPDHSAKAVYVLDLNSDTVLYQDHAQKTLYPASLTKIMTALIALENFNLDQILTVQSGSFSIGNTINLIAKDELTSKNLLFGLLVSSGNDVALTLAENFSGGYTQFVIAMNKKADQLGLTGTHFTNVSGVEDVNHFSTAEDLTKLTKVALQNPIFRQIVSTPQIDIESVKGNHYLLTSTNQLLSSNPHVLGVKTGWTPEAGECLITLVNQDEHPVLITVLGSDDRFAETTEIIDWIYKNFSWE